MAYEEQIFTNLGQVQQPDPSQSGVFLNSAQAFVIPESVDDLLQSITKQKIQSRDKEVADFNNRLATSLTTINKETDDVAPEDLADINAKQKELIKFIYDNPKGIAGLDLKAQKEISEKLFNLHATAQLSKGLNKIDKEYRDELAKNPNKVNQYLYDQWKQGTPEERAKKVFTPIKDSESAFVSGGALKKYYDTYGTSDIREETSELDPNTVMFAEYKTYDPASFRQFYKAANGDYLQAEYNLLVDKEQFPTFDDYVNSKADLLFEKERKTGRTQIKANQSMVADQRATLQEDRQSFTSEQNRKKLEAAQAKKAQALKRYPEYETRKVELDTILNTPATNQEEGKANAKLAGLEGELYKVEKTDRLSDLILDKNTKEKKKITDVYMQITPKGEKKYVFVRNIDASPNLTNFDKKVLGDNKALKTVGSPLDAQTFEEVYLTDREKSQRDQYNLYNKDVDAEIESLSVTETPQGTVTTKTVAEGKIPKGGTIAVSHNNPGNIKFGEFAKKYGAWQGRDSVEKDGSKFAVFPTIEAGLKARRDLLTGSKYADLTVDAAMKKWSNKGYGDEIYPEIRGKKISQLTNSELDELEKRQIKREDINLFKALYGNQSTPVPTTSKWSKYKRK